MAQLPSRPRRVGGLVDRGQHLRVSGAPAEVAGDTVADLVLRGMGRLGQEGGRRHQDARNAEPALRHAVPDEGILQRVERPVLAEALDRQDRAPADLHGQDQAARDRLAIQVDRARSTVAGPAPFLGPGEAEILAERVQQGLEGWTSTSTDSPFSVQPRTCLGTWRFLPGIVRRRAREGRGERAAGQDLDQVTAEIG